MEFDVRHYKRTLNTALFSMSLSVKQTVVCEIALYLDDISIIW